MRLTKKRVKELHEELWLWLSKNTEMEKGDWPRWKWCGGDIPQIAANCFPCEYAERHWDKTLPGCNCPLDFPHHGRVISSRECLGGLYAEWLLLSGRAKAAIAKQIAELPLRK